MTHHLTHLAILISGGGRTMVNLHEHIAAGKLNATIDLVISSRGDAEGVERARALGLPTIILERKAMDANTFQQSITDAVAGVDLVCMGGFLSLWKFPDSFYGRVMNIHPALLPDFGGRGMYGHRVHEAVLASDRTKSGCTVHFCDNEYDHGPIILQREVPVLPNDTPDTLAARVFKEECIAYPEAIQLFATGRLKLDGQTVTIRETTRAE
ncbi:MAG: phosphoribosylglycinamide formyltransferase [Phycisphaerae bacterium]|jgi:formyltetrahydrofolate-dependent phosphoribosylglycinamide formyltransferase